MGCNLNVVKPATLVVEIYLCYTGPEHYLELAVAIVKPLWDLDGNVMDLVIEIWIETDLCRRPTGDAEPNATRRSASASILIPVFVEEAKKNFLSINQDVKAVTLPSLPTVDLIEVELQCDFLGVFRDSLVGLFRVLAWATVAFSVPAKESSKRRICFQSSVRPAEQEPVFKVLVVDLIFGNASGWGWPEGRVEGRFGGWPWRR